MKLRGNIQLDNSSELASYVLDTGVADAYDVVLPIPVTSYTDGLKVSFLAANSNTGASTLSVDGLAAVTIKKQVTLDLDPSDILAGQIVTVIYDGTNFQIASGIGGQDLRVHQEAAVVLVSTELPALPEHPVRVGLPERVDLLVSVDPAVAAG